MKIYILKMYNDNEPFETQIIRSFKTFEQAKKALKEEVERFFGFSWDEIPDELDTPYFYFESFDEERVVYDTGQGFQFFLIEESEFEMPVEPLRTAKWFEIVLNDGNKLVAEANEADGYKEICVYLSDFNENIFQDLAVIGQQYTVGDKNGVEGIPHKYSVKVYGNPDDEDFTNEFLIDEAGIEG